MENPGKKNSKSTCYEQLPQPDPAAALEEELRKGARERKARESREKRQKRAANAKSEPTVRKTKIPCPPKYKECHHSGNFILDREILKPSDHIDLIATPRQKTKPKAPRYYVRKLPSVTNRIKILAKPSATHVKYTLQRYSAQLTAQQKLHLENLLNPQLFVTIPEAIAFAKQQRRDEAMRRLHRTRQERKLLRKILRFEALCLRATMQVLCKDLADFYLHGAPVPLEDEAQAIARTVLGCVCNFIHFPIPSESTVCNTNCEQDVMEQFYIGFSEKVAHWIWRLMDMTGRSLNKVEESLSEDKTSSPENPPTETDKGDGMEDAEDTSVVFDGLEDGEEIQPEAENEDSNVPDDENAVSIPNELGALNPEITEQATVEDIETAVQNMPPVDAPMAVQNMPPEDAPMDETTPVENTEDTVEELKL